MHFFFGNFNKIIVFDFHVKPQTGCRPLLVSFMFPFPGAVGSGSDGVCSKRF